MSTKQALPTEAVSRITASDSPLSGEGFSAFDGLVRSAHPELRQHVYRRVGSWDDADDIVQETYFKLSRVRSSSAVRNVRSYLFKMAANLAHDWNRKRRVRESIYRQESQRAPAVTRSTEDVCLSQDEFEHLLERLDDLPEKCRTALLLYRYEGLSLEEVGARLGIQKRSVLPLIARATKFLLETVSQERLSPRSKP
jgi:RNA polymerase sigma-70 factor (ECF subfamily)